MVVVASPADRTAEIAAKLDGVIVVRTDRILSAGAARNLGRSEAGEAEWLVFVDADCRPTSGAVRDLMKAARRENACAVAASVRREGGGLLGWLTHLLEFKDAEPDVPSPVTWLVPSATLLCTAAAFDAVGGFPDMWPGEDWVLCERLRRQGCCVVREPSAVTYHAPRPGLKRFFTHQFRLGATSARARAATGMTGVWFVRHPWSAVVLFLGRMARALAWLLRYRPLHLPLFIFLFPLYVAGLASWTMGFAIASRRLR